MWQPDTAVKLGAEGGCVGVGALVCGARWRTGRGVGATASLQEAASRP
jgi:hypothetical protein